MFDFDRVVDRQGTASTKWEKYRGRDVLPMWVADMDFESPPAVIEALHRRVDHQVFGYTNTPELLIETVVARLAERYDWQIDPNWLIWLPGLVAGINLACRSVGESGDQVATFTPVYRPFLTAPGFSDRQLLTVPFDQSGGNWQIDFDRLAAAITPRTRLLLLCSPHNPIGRVFRRDELWALAEFCQRHDLVICSDEIHCELVLDNALGHIVTAALDGDIARRTITLMAPSKTFNLAGLGCAFAIVPDDRLRARCKAVAAGIMAHVNLFGYSAALAAYRNGDDWHRALLDYLRGNRDRVQQAVAAMPGLSMTPVEATYLAWIDTREAGLADPAGFFESAGVGLSDGREFDGDGFVRLNFGCPRPVLDQALARMQAALG